MKALVATEIVLSSVFSWIMAIIPLMVSGVGIAECIAKGNYLPGSLLGVLFVWALVTEFWYILATVDACKKSAATAAMDVALAQPRLWIPFRQVLALWWGLHLLYALLTVFMMAHIPASNVLVVPLTMVASSGLSYLSFGYLLVAVSAVSPSPVWLHTLWRNRGRWAAAHALFALVIDYYVRHT